MNNKTNQGILPFQMVKLGSDYVAIEMAKRQALRNPNVAFIGDQVFANGTLSPLKQPANTKQTNPAPQKPTGSGAAKPKKRGFLQTLLSSAGKAVKSPAVDAGIVAGSGGTAVLYNLLGDDNNSQEASEAPKAQAKSEPKAEAPKAEPKAEAKAEPTPVTTAPSTGSDSTPKPSTTTPANGAGGSGGGAVVTENKDFIDRSLQSINEFKAKHPELFWSGVGLAGLGSIYALTKALDDDDDDEDYYYYRHR